MRRIAALAMFVSLCSARLYPETQTDSTRLHELHAKAAAAVERSDYQTAIALLTECRALARTPLEIGLTSSELGATLFRANQLNEAKKWLEQARDIWTSTGEKFNRYARTTVILAEVQRSLGQYGAAEELLRDVLSRAPAAADSSADDVEAHALALDDLADMMREEGRAGESRKLLSVAAGLPGVSWRRQLDSTLGLAQVDRDSHNWEDSIAEWNRVAEISRAHNEPAFEAVANRGLGETWLDRGDPARAEPLLRSALDAFETDETANMRQIASTLTCMAQLYLGENKLAMAEDALDNALKDDEKALGETHPQVAIVLEMLGDTRSRLNHLDLARRDLDRALQILAAAFGEESPSYGAGLATLGFIEQRARNFSRAAELYQKSMAAFGNSGPELAAFKLNVMRRYAEVLKATHHNQEAGAVMAQIKLFHTQ